MRNGLAAVRSGFFLAGLVLAAPSQAARVEIISGDGQVVPVDQPFAEPLTLRILADDGAPLAGVQVTFFVDECVSTQDPPDPACPLPTDYPLFANGRWFANGITDSHGLATSPPLHAGFGVGPFQIAGGASDFSSGWARYSLTQAAGPFVPVTSGFTGMWYDPQHPGQGLLIEVLADGRLIAFWLGHLPEGDGQAWFGGDGVIRANIATIEMRRPIGGRWPHAEPEDIHSDLWGYLVIRFADCDQALVHYRANAPEWGTGNMVLTRLTRAAGTTCP